MNVSVQPFWLMITKAQPVDAIFLFACSADTQIVDMSGIHLPAFLSHFNFSLFLRKVETILLLAFFILVSHYLFMLFYYINAIFYILTLS